MTIAAHADSRPARPASGRDPSGDPPPEPDWLPDLPDDDPEERRRLLRDLVLRALL